MTGPLSLPMVVTDSPLSFRNKIINGGFDIWQRNTSQTSNGYGSDDRWTNGSSGSTKTHSRQAFALGQTDVPGNPRYFSRTTVVAGAGASDYAFKAQKIEGVDTFAGKTATCSFYAKADAPKSLAVEFNQNFGNGGAPSAPVSAFTQKVNLTTAWQKFTITVTIPSIAGKTLGTNGDDTLGVFFWFDAGSSLNASTDSLGHQSGTFDIAQVQIEEGNVATPFEQRPIGLELSLCQRYCFVIPQLRMFGTGTVRTGGTASYGTVPTAVPMRAAPTVSGLGYLSVYVGDSLAAVGGLGTIGVIGSAVSVMPQHSAVGAAGNACAYYTTGGPLILDAEL